MKPNYKNWMPKGMIWSAAAGCAVCLMMFLVFGVSGLLAAGTLKTILTVIFLTGTVVLLLAAVWMVLMYRAFSYDGKRQMSHQIIDGVAAKVVLPEGGCGLDVGCGSGALTIAVAKCNPQARITGIDRWGVEYSSFSKTLCEENAKAEGVTNTSFAKGDALKLDFADETFDAVCSNYVYHNIPSRDRQEILKAQDSKTTKWTATVRTIPVMVETFASFSLSRRYCFITQAVWPISLYNGSVSRYS